VRAKLTLQNSSFSSLATAPEKSLMWHGVDYEKAPSNWEPQEEGMMNIAARFTLSKKPIFIYPKGKKPKD
jgi:hypothetical protein